MFLKTPISYFCSSVLELCLWLLLVFCFISLSLLLSSLLERMEGGTVLNSSKDC